jgi:radical SAM protein with 4Fe4S-binding SPASM domain
VADRRSSRFEEVVTMSRKRKKKRERLRKQEIERNKGRVYCTIRVFCEGPCRDANFKRNGRLCSEAFYKTADGEVPVKAL